MLVFSALQNAPRVHVLFSRIPYQHMSIFEVFFFLPQPAEQSQVQRQETDIQSSQMDSTNMRLTIEHRILELLSKRKVGASC